MPSDRAFDALRTVSLDLWRAVEAQHVVSTNALVETQAEQALLESLLEESKPAPPAAPNLHWLLYTPFRYPPLALGSRFRGPEDPGVWYGAEAIRTACAELGYWRWRFLKASPDLESLPARPQTIFKAGVSATGIDLRRPPFASDRALWTDPDSYRATQALGRRARASGVGLIRYESVRDPEHGGAGALLDAAGFRASAPLAVETWLLEVWPTRASWVSCSPVEERRFEFEFAAALPAG